METESPEAPAKRQNKVYFSKWASHQLYVRGGEEVQDARGNFHRLPQVMIEFSNRRFETADPELQDFLVNSADFRAGDIICMTDLEAKENQAAIAAGAPVYKLPERLLQKMTKDDLVDYAHARDIDLGATDEEIMGPGSEFTREKLVALLR